MSTVKSWNSLGLYSRDDFKYPDKVHWPLIEALDRVSVDIGRKGVVLSDWRPYDPNNPDSQHFYGLAVDVYFPGVDSLTILERLKESRLFSGIGIYTNENETESFHVDQRPNRTGEYPALWGAITAPVVVPTGETKRVRTYTTLQAVVDEIKARSHYAIGGLVLAGVLLYLFSRRS